MKRKTLIIATSIFFLGILLCILFYCFYFKKVVIYDPVNFEFNGISHNETKAIKIYGITPLNIKGSADIDNHACYKSIEIVIPDTLVSKITSILTSIKWKTFIYKISDLHCIGSSANTHTYILPFEVKSEGTFVDKLFATYPFQILLSILRLIIIIFCLVGTWFLIKFIVHRKLKKYKKNYNYDHLIITISKRSFLNIYLPIFLFLVAFCWKLCYIGVPYIWLDESGMIFNAQLSVLDILKFPLTNNEPHTPLFMLLIHFWIKIFGISPYSVRIIPLFFNALTTVFIYFTGKKFFSLWSGLLASGIFIFSTCHFYFGLETRPYSMFSLATAVSLFYFLSFIKNYENKKYLIALVFANFLLIYSHYFGWFIVFIEFLVSFMYLENKKLFKSFIISMIFTVIVFLPMIPVFISQFLVRINNYWVPKPSNIDYINQLIWFLNQNNTFCLIVLIIAVGIVLTLLNKGPKKKISRELIIVLIWWFLPYTIMFLVSEIRPIFHDRYILFNSVGLYLFIAVVVNYLYNKKHAYILGLLILIAMSVQLNVTSRHNSYAKVQNSVNYIKRIVNNSVVLIYPSCTDKQFLYYFNINIFKNVNNYDSLLLRNSIYRVDSLSEVKEKLDMYKKRRIIYAEFYGSRKIYNYLDSTFVKTDSVYYPDSFEISVFESGIKGLGIKRVRCF